MGCGKTVVAFLASLLAQAHGYQTAMMCPTEVLAEQHVHNFRRQFALLPEVLPGPSLLMQHVPLSWQSRLQRRPAMSFAGIPSGAWRQ